MAKIYWFTGKPNQGKTELGRKLHTLLKTERRNWRKSVFHIDEREFPEYNHQDDITHEIQLISKYLVKNGCDVVVSTISPNREQREIFKEEIGDDVREIYIDSSRTSKRRGFRVDEYEEPEENFIFIDTTGKSIEESYNDLVHQLSSDEMAEL